MIKDQMFGQMKTAALKRLLGRDPIDIAGKCGIQYNANTRTFCFSSLGTDLEIIYPSYEIQPKVSGWHELLILHYLDLADGTPLSGKEISFSQMESGMVRGGGIDHKCEMAIRTITEKDERKVDYICAQLGGERIQSNADIAYRIPFLPRFPVTLKVWFPDDEFPASGRLLIDESADHYFTIEDAVTVAELLIERITIPAN